MFTKCACQLIWCCCNVFVYIQFPCVCYYLKKNKWTRKPYLKKDFLEMIEKIDDKDTKELFTKYPDSDKPLVEKYF